MRIKVLVVLAALALVWPATGAAQSWTTPVTPSVGQLIDATFWNAQIRDNLIVLRAGGVTGLTLPTGGTIAGDWTTPATFTFTDAATDTVVLTNANFGVGSSSPDTLVHLSSSSGAVLRLERDDTAVVGNDVLGLIEFETNDIDAPGVAARILSSTTGTAASAQLIFETSEAGVLAEVMRLNYQANVGIGTATPDGKVHIMTASAGAVTCDESANDLCIENSAAGGATLLSADTQNVNLYWGSLTDPIGAFIRWNHNSDLFRIASSNSGASVTLESGQNVEAVRIDSSQNVGIGTTTPGELLDVDGTARVGDGTDISPDAAGAGHFKINALSYVGFIAADATAMAFGHNSAARALNFMTDETTRLSIDGGGTVQVDSGALTLPTTGTIAGNWTTPATMTWTDAATDTVAFTNAILAIGPDSPSTTQYLEISASDFSAGTGNFRLAGNRPGFRFEEEDGTANQNWQIEAAGGSFLWRTNNDSFSSASTTLELNQTGDLYLTTAGGTLGIGTTAPDGTVHIMTASAGAVTASAGSENLVVEDSDAVGISMLGGTSSQVSLRFGSSANSTAGSIFYANATDLMTYGTNAAAGALVFRSGSASEAMRIDSSQQVVIGATTAASPAATARFLEISDAASSGIVFTEGTDSWEFYHNGDKFWLYSEVAAAAITVWDETGQMGIGIEPTQPLDVAGTARIGGGTNISPDSAGSGQIQFNGSGYLGFVAMDASALGFGHNSNARRLDFLTDETVRGGIDADGVWSVNTTAGSDDSTVALNVEGDLEIGAEDFEFRTAEYSLADDANQTFTAFGGTLEFYVTEDDAYCFFVIHEDEPNTTKSVDSDNICTVAYGSDGFINVDYDTGSYRIENKRGGVRTVRVLYREFLQ